MQLLPQYFGLSLPKLGHYVWISDQQVVCREKWPQWRAKKRTGAQAVDIMVVDVVGSAKCSELVMSEASLYNTMRIEEFTPCQKK